MLVLLSVVLSSWCVVWLSAAVSALAAPVFCWLLLLVTAILLLLLTAAAVDTVCPLSFQTFHKNPIAFPLRNTHKNQITFPVRNSCNDALPVIILCLYDSYLAAAL